MQIELVQILLLIQVQLTVRPICQHAFLMDLLAYRYLIVMHTNHKDLAMLLKVQFAIVLQMKDHKNAHISQDR